MNKPHACTISGHSGIYVKSGILGFIGDGQFLAFVLILLQSSRLLGKQTKCTPQSHALIVIAKEECLIRLNTDTAVPMNGG